MATEDVEVHGNFKPDEMIDVLSYGGTEVMGIETNTNTGPHFEDRTNLPTFMRLLNIFSGGFHPAYASFVRISGDQGLHKAKEWQIPLLPRYMNGGDEKANWERVYCSIYTEMHISHLI